MVTVPVRRRFCTTLIEVDASTGEVQLGLLAEMPKFTTSPATDPLRFAWAKIVPVFPPNKVAPDQGVPVARSVRVPLGAMTSGWVIFTREPVLPGVRLRLKVEAVPGSELVALNSNWGGVVPSTIRKPPGATRLTGESTVSAMATGAMRPVNARGIRENLGSFMRNGEGDEVMRLGGFRIPGQWVGLPVLLAGFSLVKEGLRPISMRRLSKPALSRIEATCFSTVRGLMPSEPAISGLVKPFAR